MPSSGKVIFEGTDITASGVRTSTTSASRMGMVFQQFNLFPHQTVLENITLAPVQLKVMTKEQANQRAMELLERVGLARKGGRVSGVSFPAGRSSASPLCVPWL